MDKKEVTTMDKEHNVWTSECEALLAEWSEKASCYRWLHGRCEKSYRVWYYCFSIPVIILSSAIPIIQLIKMPTKEYFILSIVGCFMSFIVAYFSIDLLLKWLKSHSMTPFVIYRIIFGSLLLYITLQ